MGSLHDAQRLPRIDTWQERVHLHGEAIAVVIVLDQTDKRTNSGTISRKAHPPSGIHKRAVIAGRVSTREEQLGIRAAFLDACLQWIAQRDVEEPIR